MAISKHLLFSVLFLVGFLLASSEPADNRRPPSPRPPSPRPPPPRPPSPRPPPPRPPSPPPPRPPSPPPPRPPPPPPPSPPPPSPPPPSPSPPPPSPPPPSPSPPPPPSPTPPGFDYFMLTLQWPNALCKGKYITCSPSVPKQYFTIRGLWPRKNFQVLGPAYCDSDEEMTEDILENFQDDLLEYWPPLYSADDFDKSKKFWIKQWKKHGTCSSNKFSPEAYLEATIALGKDYGPLILSTMEELGIEPDGITLHTANEILDAIEQATHTAALIRCSKDESGNLQLHDIRLCVEADGHTLQDCKSIIPEGNCIDKFIFPSPPSEPDHTRFPSYVSSIVDVEEAVGI